MEIKKVLFVCIHNSARSQIAEAFVNLMGKGKFVAESAGIEPGKLNPVVVQAMQQIGIDISGNPTKSVFDFFNAGKKYDYVITVCDETAGEKCPYIPGMTNRLHWGFDDPSGFQGSPEEKLTRTGVVRDQIKKKIEEFLKENS